MRIFGYSQSYRWTVFWPIFIGFCRFRMVILGFRQFSASFRLKILDIAVRQIVSTVWWHGYGTTLFDYGDDIATGII